MKSQNHISATQRNIAKSRCHGVVGLPYHLGRGCSALTRRKIIFAALTATSGLPALLRAQSDRELALWLGIKRDLEKGGQAYFESTLKDCDFPPLKGKVASATIAEGRSDIRLVMNDGANPEVTLIVHLADAIIRTKPAPGDPIEFTGVAREFTASPFMLTVETEVRRVTGLHVEPRA
jgi:hypothetical protein